MRSGPLISIGVNRRLSPFWVRSQHRRVFSSHRTYHWASPGVFRAAFFERAQLFIAPVQPFRMNERLTIQQGLFLCPGNVTSLFEDNLAAYAEPGFESHVHKIVVPATLREEILGELNSMNISRASLFPGIDGFAQSLLTNLHIVMAAGRLSQELSKLGVFIEYGFL